jgi:hypothetical protein
MPMKPAAAEVVPQTDAEEDDPRDRGNREVLPAKVRGSSFLHGAGDLLHALATGRQAQDAQRQDGAPGDTNARAEQGKEHAVVQEEVRHEVEGLRAIGQLVPDRGPRILITAGDVEALLAPDTISPLATALL